MIQIDCDRKVPVNGLDLKGFLPTQELLNKVIESALLHFQEKRLPEQANNFKPDELFYRITVSYPHINLRMVSEDVPLEFM
jgi:hypothetical protein